MRTNFHSTALQRQLCLSWHSRASTVGTQVQLLRSDVGDVLAELSELDSRIGGDLRQMQLREQQQRLQMEEWAAYHDVQRRQRDFDAWCQRRRW